MMHLTIAGHLGADPEERITPSGQKVTSFRVAVNTRTSGQEETVWWRVTVWGDRFDKFLSYLKKGSGVIVTGRMRPSNIWTDREGKPQVGHEITAEMIEFIPGKKAQEGAAGSSTHSSAYPGFSQQAAGESQAPSPAGTSQQNAFGQPHPVGQTAFGQGNEEFSDDDPLPF